MISLESKRAIYEVSNASKPCRRTSSEEGCDGPNISQPSCRKKYL